MKALVHGSRVCQIAAEPFPVAPAMTWVECDETITTSHTYVDGAFVPPVVAVPSHNEQIDAQIREIEAANPITHRASREGLYAQALLADMLNETIAQIEAQIRTIQGHEAFTIQRLPDLKKNAGMVRIKTADDAIRVLRAQRLP